MTKRKGENGTKPPEKRWEYDEAQMKRQADSRKEGGRTFEDKGIKYTVGGFTTKPEVSKPAMTLTTPRQERDIDRLGDEAYKALMRVRTCRDWGDWMVVAEGVYAGAELAMREAKRNDRKGRRYNELFNQWLIRHPVAY